MLKVIPAVILAIGAIFGIYQGTHNAAPASPVTQQREAHDQSFSDTWKASEKHLEEKKKRWAKWEEDFHNDIDRHEQESRAVKKIIAEGEAMKDGHADEIKANIERVRADVEAAHRQ